MSFFDPRYANFAQFQPGMGWDPTRNMRAFHQAVNPAQPSFNVDALLANHIAAMNAQAQAAQAAAMGFGSFIPPGFGMQTQGAFPALAPPYSPESNQVVRKCLDGVTVASRIDACSTAVIDEDVETVGAEVFTLLQRCVRV